MEPPSTTHTFVTEMKAVADSISDSIRILMQPLPRRFSGATCLAFALLGCFSVDVGAIAQSKKPAAKPRTTTTQRPAAPQQRAPVRPLEPLPANPSIETADIAITARVRAESLRFDVVPNPKVNFPGQPERNTVWEAERENLPNPVEPGITYRDIGIRLKITSVFTDIDRIVAEALGEVPVSEDAKAIEPIKTTTPAANPKPALATSQPTASRPRKRERR